MANITGWNWDGTPIYELPNVTVKATKGNKNTYQGPFNWDYYNAQNGTVVGKSWNEIAEGLFGTPNVSEVYGGTPPPSSPNNNNLLSIAVIILLIIAIFIIYKK